MPRRVLSSRKCNFDAPALKVEFAEGCDWVDDGIEKGRDDEALCRAEAVGCKMDFNDAKGEGSLGR